MQKHIVIFLSLSLSVLFSACGGGGGESPPPSPPPPPPVDNRTLLSGEYQAHKLEYEGSNVIAQTFTVTADGQGNLQAAGYDIVYSVDEDRNLTLTFPHNPTVESSYGKVTSDGNLAITTEAVLDDPDTQNDVETLLIVKKSTTNPMTAARIKGEYLVNQAGFGPSGYYTSQVQVVLLDTGTGGWLIIRHTSASEVGKNGALTYVINSDGTFTLDNGSGESDVGIFAPSADVFVMTDGVPGADSEVLYAVGVRKSVSAPPISEPLQMHFIGYDVANGYPYGPQFASRWGVLDDATKTSFIATCLIDSRGIAAGTLVSIPHTAVQSDGTFVSGADQDEFGIVSPDGVVMTIVETDDSVFDSEMKLGVALQ